MGKTKKQQHKVERLLAALDVDAELLRDRMAAFTEAIEVNRAACRDARTAQQARELELERDVRASFADLSSRSVQSLAAFESSLVGLRDRAVTKVDEQAASYGAHLTGGLTEILAGAEREVREAHEDACRRIDDAVARVEQMTRDAVRQAQEDACRRIDDAVALVEQVARDAAHEAVVVAPEPEWQAPEPELEWQAPESEPEWQVPAAAFVDEFPVPVPPADVSASAPASATATRVAPPHDSRPARRPVNAKASLAALAASTGVLARYAADERVRVEVVHVAIGGRSASYLRLTAYNVAGWWEYHDVPAKTDTKEPQSAVVELGELANALESSREHSDDPEVVVRMDGDLTIGNVLLLDHPGTDPVLPYHRQRIERVDLGAADRTGLAIETQVGRVFVPPRLISFLKTRNAATSELLMVEEWPCLSAQIGSPTEGTTAMIVSRLAPEGATVDESTEERRNAAGSEVEQLVRALSADTTVEQLEQILRTGVGYARRRAAAHPALPPSVIHELLDVGTETIRAAAASNPSISEEACSLGAADRSEIVRAAIAENPAATPTCLELLAFDPVTRVRERAAANAQCTRELLTRLADDADSSVRAAAAQNPAQDPDALDALAHDPDPRVCAAVAGNPACPEPLLQELLSLVPEAVLANPGAPASVLAAGCRADARQLRTAVAANPATPVKQLQALARDGDPEVVRAVAENPITPAHIRRRARRRLSG